MGEIKAKTMMQKSGFMDPDKKSPEHDKIQTWCYKNMKKVLCSAFNTSKEFEIVYIKWEHEIVQRSNQMDSSPKFIIGFVDFKVVVKNKEETIVYIEVKPKIPSLGELIRQMNFYKTYLGNRARYLVISPDDSYCDILKGQGFHFYKYKDEQKLF